MFRNFSETRKVICQNKIFSLSFTIKFVKSVKVYILYFIVRSFSQNHKFFGNFNIILMLKQSSRKRKDKSIITLDSEYNTTLYLEII